MYEHWCCKPSIGFANWCLPQLYVYKYVACILHVYMYTACLDMGCKPSQWAEKLYIKMTAADRRKVQERASRMQKVMTTQTVSKSGRQQVSLAGNI